MATITVDSDKLNVQLGAWDTFWAFHGSLHVPLADITGVRIADQAAWSRAWNKLIGTNMPGMKTAGTFFSKDGMVFCDYNDGRSCLEIEVAHEFYKKLVIQLEDGVDPAAVAAKIGAAIGR